MNGNRGAKGSIKDRIIRILLIIFAIAKDNNIDMNEEFDRMNEDGGFVFTCSSAAFFEWVEKNNPSMFEEIKRRVGCGVSGNNNLIM